MIVWIIPTKFLWRWFKQPVELIHTDVEMIWTGVNIDKEIVYSPLNILYTLLGSTDSMSSIGHS